MLPYDTERSVLNRMTTGAESSQLRCRTGRPLHGAAALLQSRGEPAAVQNVFTILVESQSDTGGLTARAF